MKLPEAINAVTQHKDLSADEMTMVMRAMMSGDATPAQIGGFLIGLRMKGETVEEIAAAAGVMRELATVVTVDKRHLVDTCGTGGDASRTFNISTAAALVAAAAGARVAKHGNRSVSSQSGSADVLEEAGVKLNIGAKQVARCIDAVGVGFLFAPMHHSAMRHAIGPRREMGVRTVFNLLGPLTNPAAAPNQVIGVFSEKWLRPIAEVLERLGSQHVMVVNAEDGLDEISIAAPTHVAELKQGEITTYSVDPSDFGMQRARLDAIRVGSAQQSLEMIKAVLNGQQGAARDIVCLNAGAAIYVAGLVESLETGVALADEQIFNTKAQRVLEELVKFTNEQVEDALT